MTKRSRTKRIAMLVTGMLLLSLLSGCGANTAADSLFMMQRHGV